MKEVLIQIIDELFRLGMDKTSILGIINPIKTEGQATKLYKWIQQNKEATAKEMSSKAHQIVQ